MPSDCHHGLRLADGCLPKAARIPQTARVKSAESSLPLVGTGYLVSPNDKLTTPNNQRQLIPTNGSLLDETSPYDLMPSRR